jgi:hypothetical protein
MVSKFIGGSVANAIPELQETDRMPGAQKCSPLRLSVG